MTTWGTTPDDTTVLRLYLAQLEREPDAEFLNFSGKIVTYDELWNDAAAIAGAMDIAGVSAGDTVAAMMDNSADAVATWFAANMLGAVWVPVNTALRGDFLQHVISDSGASIVLCEGDLADRLLHIRTSIPSIETIIMRGDAEIEAGSDIALVPFDEFRTADVPSLYDPTPHHPSCIIYTGGTTGPSKGCLISHGYAVHSARAALDQMERSPNELNWSCLPIFHYNLLACTIIGSMILGGQAAIAPRFSTTRFWPDVLRTNARIVNLLGSMGSLLAQMPDTTESLRCFGQIRLVYGVPFPAPLQAVWRERFGAKHVGAATFGQTEAFPQTTQPCGDPAPEGSSGRRYEAIDVRIFDDDDQECPPNEVGEIVLRPNRPNMMFQGYWRNPQATADSMRNMWFHTGDLGRFDEEGYLYFVDRKQDYLRCKGENISSQEVESVFLQHEAIQQVAVHPVDSPLTEDDLKVTAVLAAGADLTAEQLFEWARTRVPYFALPRYIEFREGLPLSPVGRAHKFILREEGVTAGTWDRERAATEWERR